jgi:hypothetical protein
MSEFPSVASVEIDPTRYMLEKVDFKIAPYQKLSRQQRNRHYAVSALAILITVLSINLLSRQADISMNPPTFRSKRPPGRWGQRLP